MAPEYATVRAQVRETQEQRVVNQESGAGTVISLAYEDDAGRSVIRQIIRKRANRLSNLVEVGRALLALDSV